MLRGDQCSLFKKPRDCKDAERISVFTMWKPRNYADAER